MNLAKIDQRKLLGKIRMKCRIAKFILRVSGYHNFAALLLSVNHSIFRDKVSRTISSTIKSHIALQSSSNVLIHTPFNLYTEILLSHFELSLFKFRHLERKISQGTALE
jgi:hypothetical protein